MVFEYTNKKGTKYYLNQRGRLYFFSRKSSADSIDLPSGYQVVESESTGLPMLKKK
ncbi:MAG: hypothetical protein HY917_00725 [Candidatus Diapherotrites archaeon]|nr:hypothetical protein [Candidatus Diapherotrites archaeon]